MQVRPRASLPVPAVQLAPVRASRDAVAVFERRQPKQFLAAALLVGLAACTAPPRPEGALASPEAPAPAPGPGTLFRVVESDVTIEVYRDGPLAQLGHNHVIASTSLAGQVMLREPLSDSSFVLELPLTSLTVDEPARRSAAGDAFPDNLTEEDKAGTRRNMLSDALLDADQFPVVQLSSLAISPTATGLSARTRVTIAGREREIEVPIVVRPEGERLSVSGEFALTHAGLGLTPFSVAMGALRVRDDMRVVYRLVARRDAGAS